MRRPGASPPRRPARSEAGGTGSGGLRGAGRRPGNPSRAGGEGPQVPSRQVRPAPAAGAGTRGLRPRPAPAPRAHLHAAAAPPAAPKATCPCPPWTAPARAATDPQVTGLGCRWGGGERTLGQGRVASGGKPGWRVRVSSSGRRHPRVGLGDCGGLWSPSASDLRRPPQVHSHSGTSVVPACVTSSGAGP